jgi:LytR cell envelope-related transcriptional attenuator
VDHLSDLPAQQPWRNAAFIAATVATVELAILLVVGIIVFGKFFAGEVEKASDPVAVTQAAVEREKAAAATAPSKGNGQPREQALLQRRKTSVIVLNGNGISGAAATAADGIRAQNYLIAATGNAPRTDFTRSVVMYRPGFEAEARRLARDIGVQRVSPLDGIRKQELQGAHIALIIGG